MFAEIVTAGNILSPHLFVVKTMEKEQAQMIDTMGESKVVFKLGRAPTCEVIINQNTISRTQCCLIWWPKLNKWSIMDGDIDAPEV